MKLFYRLLLGSLVLLSNTSSLKADHLIGGELTQKALGNNKYEIHLKLYRNCNTFKGTPYDDFAVLWLYDHVTGELIGDSINWELTKRAIKTVFPGSDTLPNTTNNPCVNPPAGLCVEEAIYMDTIDFTGLPIKPYRIVYQRCCRVPDLVNITLPLHTGNTYELVIKDYTQNNSTPEFNSLAPVVLCTGWDFSYDHSATDPDNDSLAYYLCPPKFGRDTANPWTWPGTYAGGGSIVVSPEYSPWNYDTVVWGTGYNSNYQIDADPAFSIDPNTGLLTGTPTKQGKYVFGVCVDEYRDDTLLTTITRDYNFTIAGSCRPLTIALDATTSDNDTIALEGCESIIYTFTKGTAEAEDEVVHYAIKGNAVNGDDYNTIIDSITIPANQTSVTLTLDPILDGLTEDDELITIKLSAQNECLKDTLSKSISIVSVDSLELNMGDDQEFYCRGDELEITANGDKGTKPYNYAWSNDTGSVGTKDTILIYPKDTTRYILTVVDACGQTKRDSLQINFIPNPINVEALPDTFFTCPGDSLLLGAIATGGYDSIFYSWTPGNINSQQAYVTPNDTITYTVLASDKCGNTVDTDSMTLIRIIQPIGVLTSPDTFITCPGDSVILNASAVGGQGELNYLWTPGGYTDSLIVVNPLDTTNYLVTVSDNCNNPIDSDQVSVIRVITPINVSISQTENFNCPDDEVEICFSTTGGIPPLEYEWIWSNQSRTTYASDTCLLDNPDSSTTYTLTVSDDCQNPTDNASITIEMNTHPPLLVEAGSDTTICTENGNTIILNAIGSGGYGELIYLWMDSLGNEVSLSQQTEVGPNHSQSFIIQLSDYCNSTVVKDSLFVTVACELTIPNVFTPLSPDGYNDFLIIENIEYFPNSKLEVYNRWGRIVFQSDDYKNEWDGKINHTSRVASEGVYFYILRRSDGNNYSGTVTLLYGD